MEDKITLSMLLLGVSAVIISIILTGMTFHKNFEKQVEQNIESITAAIVLGYKDGNDSSELDKYATEITRITLVDEAGNLVYESDSAAPVEANVLDGEEMRLAVKNGEGIAVRFDEESNKDIYYYAVAMENGDILRVSIAADTMLSTFSESRLALLSIFIIVMIMAVVMALMLTRKLMAPIKRLKEQLDDPDLAGDEKRVYRELAPFINEIQSQRHDRESMRQEFTANVSHELKTPLTSISGYSELIENGVAQGEDARRFGGIIHKEAGRMLLLISDIIRLSELDEGKEEQPAENVELLRVVNECRDTLAASAEKKDVKIVIKGEPCTVLGNSYQLWELVYNLVDNAIRYNHDGGTVTVTVGNKNLCVEDTGIGIPKDHQGRIFERFYRVDKSHSRETGGTGLGLSIVKHVAGLHRATLSVESELGVGTKITVIFP